LTLSGNMEEIFNRLSKAGLTPNAFYVLYCFKSKIDFGINVNSSLENSRLESDGWVVAGNLTPKAINFISDIDKFFKVSNKKTSSAILGADFSDNIDVYLEIFPNFKLPSGKYARSSKKNLETNFRWFFENHKYTWETILAASRMYVEEYQRNGYKYMKTSQYFIRKLSPAEKTFDSELANYCEAYLTGASDYSSDNYFKEKVV
jgi:hypothetical protein